MGRCDIVQDALVGYIGMMIRPLLPDDHPLLTTEMPRFDFKVDNAQELARILVESMTYYGGFGFAANQIGIEKSVFAMQTIPGPIVLFNPLVTWISTESVMYD